MKHNYITILFVNFFYFFFIFCIFSFYFVNKFTLFPLFSCTFILIPYISLRDLAYDSGEFIAALNKSISPIAFIMNGCPYVVSFTVIVAPEHFILLVASTLSPFIEIALAPAFLNHLKLSKYLYHV